MRDHFKKVSKKRERPSKQARSPETGQFEEMSPLNNPDLMSDCVRWIRAADELLPVLRILAREPEADDGQEPELVRYRMVGARFLGAWLIAFRATLLDEIAVDKDASREARKPRLMTPREQELQRLLMEGKL